MTKINPAKAKRRVVTDHPHALLTGAEARAEAAYLVLGLLLPQLSQSMCKRIMAKAYIETDSLDIDAVTEEVECLFNNIVFESPTR